MNNFILTSLIASVVLTLALNIFPILFPKSAVKAQRKLEENARRAIEQHDDENRPNVKVFFPWKLMIIISIGLTVIVNIVSFLSHG